MGIDAEDIKSMPKRAFSHKTVPWIAGSRAPFSDNDIGGMLYNMHTNTDKAVLARSAVLSFWVLYC